MLARFGPASLAFAAVLPFAACSAAPQPAAAVDDGGTFEAPRDAAPQPSAPDDAKAPWARLQAHGGNVLRTMRLSVVYLGVEGAEGAPSFDAFLDWLLTSDYWGVLGQYGVGKGARVASVRVAASRLISGTRVTKGLITSEDLELALHAALHPVAVDAGTGGADAARDADAATDSDAPAGALAPPADAYLVFLPAGVNVNLGERGSKVYQTCIDAGGYHAFDGDEPYAVIPPCALGRSGLAVSHELAEMATDPVPPLGWSSPKDAANAGGEVGDLCNQPAPPGAAGTDGRDVTQLWSNADGDCEPN